MDARAQTANIAITQEGSQFGQTQVSGGLNFQGNFTGLTINSAAAAHPDDVGHYSHTLLQPVKAYVQRPALCNRVREQLNLASSQDQRQGTRILAIWGLGGAGKTQLALDYLHRHRAEYTTTFWIEAGRKESIERDFVCIHQLLFGLRTAAGQEMIKADEAVLGVKGWFSSRHDRLLLVFDGADAVDNKQDDEYDLRHFVPDSPFLDVIVTTRSRTVKDMNVLDGVEVGEMEEQQAVDLFYGLSTLKDRCPNTEDEIKRVVSELGCFALAVTLAGTYVSQTPRLLSDIRQYLPEYRERRRELLSQKPKGLTHQYSESIQTTWETSFQAVGRQCSEACRLLTLLAFLSFDDIFLGLFVPNVKSNEGASSDESRSSIFWRLVVSPSGVLDKYMIEECFRVLQTYSLVQWKEDQGSYSMHKLVHAWGYERLSVEDQRGYSLAGVALLIEARLGCKGEPQAKLRLVSHIMTNFAMIARQTDWSGYHVEGTFKYLSRTAEFLYDIGRWAEAFAIQEFVYREWREVLGEEHLFTISAMNNLADILRIQGQLDKAAAIQKDVLEKYRRTLGEEHPDTIIAMSNLTITLQDQGQLDEAAAIQKEVLKKRRRILGEEHLDTIIAMSNLAITLRDQGQLDEAAAIQKEVLKKRRRILGEEHLDTIIAMSNLAITLQDQGQLDEAAAIQKEALKKRRRILGEEHPDTITAMNNLAITLQDQGQLDEAAAIQKEALKKRRRILGEEHPDTITAMYNLACMLGDQGEAAVMMKEVLEKMRRILGEEHPKTKRAAKNLAMKMYRQEAQLNAGI